MDAKQSLSVVLMLSLLTPLASCGEAQNGDNGKDKPQVESPAGSPAPASPSASPKDEGGEGGES